METVNDDQNVSGLDNLLGPLQGALNMIEEDVEEESRMSNLV